MHLPLKRPLIIVAVALGLGACSTYGYDDYSSARVSVGYGSGYSQPYYGWYDDYYYPGTGYYVWDRRGYRHTWSDRHRRYWTARRAGHQHFRDDWRGYRYERRGDYVRADQRRYRDQRDLRRYREERRELRQRERARRDAIRDRTGVTNVRKLRERQIERRQRVERRQSERRRSPR